MLAAMCAVLCAELYPVGWLSCGHTNSDRYAPETHTHTYAHTVQESLYIHSRMPDRDAHTRALALGHAPTRASALEQAHDIPVLASRIYTSKITK